VRLIILEMNVFDDVSVDYIYWLEKVSPIFEEEMKVSSILEEEIGFANFGRSCYYVFQFL
jgi:hypothetical protein